MGRGLCRGDERHPVRPGRTQRTEVEIRPALASAAAARGTATTDGPSTATTDGPATATTEGPGTGPSTATGTATGPSNGSGSGRRTSICGEHQVVVGQLELAGAPGRQGLRRFQFELGRAFLA